MKTVGMGAAEKKTSVGTDENRLRKENRKLQEKITALTEENAALQEKIAGLQAEAVKS